MTSFVEVINPEFEQVLCFFGFSGIEVIIEQLLDSKNKTIAVTASDREAKK